MDYRDVNKLRYEKIDYDDAENNMYAAVNPAGNYSFFIGFKTVRWFIKTLRRYTHIKYSDLRLLDVGCGDGHITRMMCSLLDKSSNVYGFDYSENNIIHCNELNSSINYSIGNITENIPFPGKFDGITAFVVLSHLRKEEDVKKALSIIYDALENHGLFLWYELVSKSHYINPEKDTQGFNYRELRKYAEEAGFIEIDRKYFSRDVWIGNKHKSIWTYTGENNIWFLEGVAKILPLRPAITIRIFKKRVVST